MGCGVALLLGIAWGLALPVAGAAVPAPALDGDWLDRAWDFERPAESEARFRAELAVLPPDSAARLELLTQLARAQGLQRHFAAAHTTLDAVEQALPGSPERVVVRYLLERGRVFNSAQQADRAVPLFLAALERARAAGEDFLAIDAAHMLGIAAPAEARLQWNLDALALTEQTRDPRARRWLGSLYNNIGWTYHDRGEYRTALTYFEQALHAAQARADPRAIRIARWTVARAYRSLGRYDEALVIQRELACEWAETDAPDGFVYEELGELLLAKGDAAAAQDNFARAYALLAQDAGLQANEPERLARLRRLGGIQ
jgi:tetratricopeptide (TPR) repeat protein